MHWGIVRGACMAGHLVQGRVDLFLRSVAGYLGLALVFVWGGARRGGFSLSFGGFLLVLAGLSFWRGGWALGYRSMCFGQFPGILILNLFGSS